MIDLHSHLLPYVDDGAHDLDEAEKLLSMEAAQGAEIVCVTPHLRQDMFETPDEAIQKQFARLSRMAEDKGLRLYLSREYHYDELFREKLRTGSVLPLGAGVILTEFSIAHSPRQMLAAVEEAVRCRYTPLIAHAERYPAADAEVIAALRAAGALIQVNGDSVLGLDGRYLKKRAWDLLKAGLADVIASDAHSTDERPPRLDACRAILTKKLGEDAAMRLMLRNPQGILASRRRGGSSDNQVD